MLEDRLCPTKREESGAKLETVSIEAKQDGTNGDFFQVYRQLGTSLVSTCGVCSEDIVAAIGLGNPFIGDAILRAGARLIVREHNEIASQRNSIDG